MILTGLTFIYLVPIFLLLFLLLFIFAKRQIIRLTSTGLKRIPFTPIGQDMPKSFKQDVLEKIELTASLRGRYQPRLSSMVDENLHTPNSGRVQQDEQIKYRAQALDELKDVGELLDSLNCPLQYFPNRSLYSFLKQLQGYALSALDDEVIERVTLLHEWARYRPEPFTGNELEELRQHVRLIKNMIDREQSRLSAASELNGRQQLVTADTPLIAIPVRDSTAAYKRLVAATAEAST